MYIAHGQFITNLMSCNHSKWALIGRNRYCRAILLRDLFVCLQTAEGAMTKTIIIIITIRDANTKVLNFWGQGAWLMMFFAQKSMLSCAKKKKKFQYFHNDWNCILKLTFDSSSKRPIATAFLETMFSGTLNILPQSIHIKNMCRTEHRCVKYSRIRIYEKGHDSDCCLYNVGVRNNDVLIVPFIECVIFIEMQTFLTKWNIQILVGFNSSIFRIIHTDIV